MPDGYRLSLALVDRDGGTLAEAPMEADFEPAEEWLWLEAVRRGFVQPGETLPETTIRPLWDADTGEPHLAGFQLLLARPAGDPVICAFGPRYFREAVLQAVEELAGTIERKALDGASYRVTAYPRDRQSGARPGFEAAPEPRDLDLPEASLEELGAGAVLLGEMRARELPVLVPARLLDEIAEAVGGAEGIETGGVLVGQVHRDPATAELFVRVAAQMPARHTEASSVSLTFTPQTWTDVRTALELRGRGERMVGWWHSHPVRVWCKDCPPERQRSCRLARDFLSAHDRTLHRAVFPRAYSVALVANDGADGRLTFSLFGWRAGRLEPRSFAVVGPGAEAWGAAGGNTEVSAAAGAESPGGEVCEARR